MLLIAEWDVFSFLFRCCKFLKLMSVFLHWRMALKMLSQRQTARGVGIEFTEILSKIKWAACFLQVSAKILYTSWCVKSPSSPIRYNPVDYGKVKVLFSPAGQCSEYLHFQCYRMALYPGNLKNKETNKQNLQPKRDNNKSNNNNKKNKLPLPNKPKTWGLRRPRSTTSASDNSSQEFISSKNWPVL